MKIKSTFFIVVIGFCFVIPAASQIENGTIYRIKNVNSGRYAQTGYGSMENGATIHLYDKQEADHFKWKAIAVRGGFYKFQNMNSNKFLVVLDAGKRPLDKICQWDDVLRQATIWKLEKTSSGFKIINNNSKLLMGVAGGGKENGALLVQSGENGALDKIWQFEKINLSTASKAGNKVLVDVVLHYIAINEATRNRLDNGDCKRVFGTVQTEIWELDGNNQMKTQLASYDNNPEFLFNERNFQSPPPIGVSYQFHMEYAENNTVGTVTYNIPESLLQQKKIMLVVKTNLGTRHKDNDFATYDCLKMGEEIQSTFIVGSDGSLNQTITANTDLASSRRDMHLQDYVIPFAVFQKTDDTHKLWLNITSKKK